MEPNDHSQKTFTLSLDDQVGFKKALTAKLSHSISQLMIGRSTEETDMGNTYVTGQINNRPSDTGSISKVIIDGYFCSVHLVVVSFSLDDLSVGDYVHFLLEERQDGTFVMNKDSHCIVNSDADFDDIDLGLFFQE